MGICARCMGNGWYLAQTVALGPIRPFGSAVYEIAGVRVQHVPAGKLATCIKSQRCGKCNANGENDLS